MKAKEVLKILKITNVILDKVKIYMLGVVNILVI